MPTRSSKPKDRDFATNARRVVEQAIGVERVAIFRDYCETNNHFGLVSPRMERMMKIMSLGHLQMENVRASLSAREEYLQAAFDQIDQRHGGLSAYLAKCGVTAEEIETLRNPRSVRFCWL